MRNSLLRAAVVLVLLTSAACAKASESPGGTEPTTKSAPPTDLDAARAAWQTADVGSYQLKIKTQCFCAPQEYRIVVNDDGSVQTKAPEDYLPETVDDLFAIIQGGYDSNAASVDVTYNDVGVPLDIYIDQSATMADEEIGYKVTFEDLQ